MALAFDLLFLKRVLDVNEGDFKVKLRSRLFVSAFFLLFLASCTGPRPTKSGPPYQVLLPWSENGSDYKLQIVEIKTLQDLEQMKGDVAEVKIKYTSNKSTALAQFTQRDDGVYVPTDIHSLQAATTYAHTEKLFEFDRSLGINQTFLSPRQIVIEAKVNTSFSEEEKDNAIYMGGSDTIYFVPYTMSQIPITVNGGIIAHEHFHGIFWEYVMRHLINSKKELESFHRVHDNWYRSYDQSSEQIVENTDLKDETIVSPQDPKFEEGSNNQHKEEKELAFENKFMLLVQSLNEGLADYWGYMYSNRVGFIEDSIKSQVIRNMSISGVVWTKQYLKFFNECIGFHKLKKTDVVKLSYQLGSNHARLLANLEKSIGREKLSKILVSILPQLKEKLMEIKSLKLEVDLDFLIQMIKSHPDLKSETTEELLQKYSIDQNAKGEVDASRKYGRFKCKED